MVASVLGLVTVKGGCIGGSILGMRMDSVM